MNLDFEQANFICQMECNRITGHMKIEIVLLPVILKALKQLLSRGGRATRTPKNFLLN